MATFDPSQPYTVVNQGGGAAVADPPTKFGDLTQEQKDALVKSYDVVDTGDGKIQFVPVKGDSSPQAPTAKPVFDPTKPYTVVPAFDPSKPFTVVGEQTPQFTPEGKRIVPMAPLTDAAKQMTPQAASDEPLKPFLDPSHPAKADDTVTLPGIFVGQPDRVMSRKDYAQRVKDFANEPGNEGFKALHTMSSPDYLASLGDPYVQFAEDMNQTLGTEANKARAPFVTPIVSPDVFTSLIHYTDVLNAASPILPESVKQFLSGSEESAGATLAEFTKPTNLALLGLGGAPKAVQVIAGLTFAGMMGKQLPDAWKAIEDAKTPEERGRAVTSFVTTGAMTLLAGAGSAHVGRGMLKEFKKAGDANANIEVNAGEQQNQGATQGQNVPENEAEIRQGAGGSSGGGDSTPREVTPENVIPFPEDELTAGTGDAATQSEFGLRPGAATAAHAGTPVEFPEQRTTGLAKAVVKDERLARGLEDLPQAERKSQAAMVRAAEDRMDTDPQGAQRLLTKILDEGKTAITDDDAATILVERNRVMNERRTLENEWYDPETSPARKAEVDKQLNGLEEQLNRLDMAQRLAGSTTGRTLRMYQALIKEDYTLEAMESRARKAKAAPLSTEERAKIKEMSDKIAVLTDRVAAFQDMEARLAEQKAVTDTYQKMVADLQAKKDAPYSKVVLDTAKRIVDKWNQEAEIARRELRQSMGQTTAGVDPANAIRIAKIMRAYISEHGLNFAEHSARIVNEFGDWVKPLLEKAWDQAQRMIDGEDLSSTVKTVLKKGVKKGEAKPVDVKARAKAESVAGEALSHRTVYELAQAHVNNGVHGEDAVMKAVHDDIKEYFPDATERDVRRAFSEYGKVTFPSKDAVKTELRELRTLTRLQESIDRLKERQDALHTGPQRDKATQAIREKTKQLNELLKKRQGPPSPEKLASNMEARKTALRNSIEDLDKQLRTGEKPPGRTEPLPLDPEGERLKAERDAMKAKLDEIEKGPAPTDEERYNATRMKAIGKQIEDIKARMAKGIYTKEPRKLTPAKSPETVKAWSELQRLKRTSAELAEKLRLSQRSPSARAVDAIKSLYHGITGLAIMGHGTVGMVTHGGGLIFRLSRAVPYWRNFGRQFGMWVNPAYHVRLIYALENHPRYDFWRNAGLAIDPYRTYTDYGMYAEWLGKFAMGGKRGFDALKLARLELAEADWKGVSSDIKADPVQSAETAKRIAQITDEATGTMGRGTDRIRELARNKIANDVFFSPRLYASRFTRVVLDPVTTAKTFWNWKTASSADKVAATTRLKHAAEFTAGLMGALITNQAILKATGSSQSVNFSDYKKRDWLKFKGGGYEVSLDGGLLDPVRLIGQVVIGDLVQDRTANQRYREGTRYQKASDDLMNWVRGKFNPSFGLIIDASTGSDYAGRPMPWSNEPGKYKEQPKYEWGEWILSHGMIPLSNAAKIVYDEMRKNGLSSTEAKTIIKGAAIAATGMTGAHVSTEYVKPPAAVKPVLPRIPTPHYPGIPSYSH